MVKSSLLWHNACIGNCAFQRSTTGTMEEISGTLTGPGGNPSIIGMYFESIAMSLFALFYNGKNLQLQKL